MCLLELAIYEIGRENEIGCVLDGLINGGKK